jgi:hypothetical protein
MRGSHFSKDLLLLLLLPPADRIITRYDAVPTQPSSSSGYDHYMPFIW